MNHRCMHFKIISNWLQKQKIGYKKITLLFTYTYTTTTVCRTDCTQFTNNLKLATKTKNWLQKQKIGYKKKNWLQKNNIIIVLIIDLII